MSVPKVVMFTDRFDLDVDAVILRLRELGVFPTRVVFDDIPAAADFSLSIEGPRWTGKLRTRNRSIELREVGSILWRKPGGVRLTERPSVAQQLIWAEVERGLAELPSFADCHWMNAPLPTRQARQPLGQLKRAADLGFEVPRTIVTSVPDQAKAFFESCQRRMILKPLGDTTIAGGEAAAPHGKTVDARLGPSLVQEAHLQNHLAEIASTPCLLQELVSKKAEWRVTIVGDDLFVAQIESETTLRPPADRWKKDAPIVVRKGTLPPGIETRCVALAKGMGLDFCTIDLLLTPDDRLVFADCNPQGQFVFLEARAPELRITHAVAARLLDRASAGGATDRASSTAATTRAS